MTEPTAKAKAMLSPSGHLWWTLDEETFFDELALLVTIWVAGHDFGDASDGLLNALGVQCVSRFLYWFGFEEAPPADVNPATVSGYFIDAD